MDKDKPLDFETDDSCFDKANLQEQEVTDSPPNPVDTQADAQKGAKADSEDLDYETMYDEMQDKYYRYLAEFDNFRKRSIKEKAEQYDSGVRDVVKKLLPLVDNFERAVDCRERDGKGSIDESEDSFYQGIALIVRQFDSILTDLDIETISTLPGDNFDPRIHNAVAHVEDDSFGANQVVEILQKGYLHKNKVVRTSMVKVAN